jgi:hypothetical protein
LEAGLIWAGPKLAFAQPSEFRLDEKEQYEDKPLGGIFPADSNCNFGPFHLIRPNDTIQRCLRQQPYAAARQRVRRSGSLPANAPIFGEHNGFS